MTYEYTRATRRKRRQDVVRWLVSGAAKLAIVFLVLFALRWLIIVMWAGFGT